MRKPVMVQGGSIAFGAGASVSGGAFVISSLPSVKTKVDGQGAFFGPLAWTFSGGNAPGCTPGTVAGAGAINPGALSMKDDGLFAVLEDDQVTATFAGVSPTPPYPPVTIPGQVVKVSSSGQSKVKAD